MQEFNLPVVEETTPVEQAFGPMIRLGVSGIVVRRPKGNDLLHYADVHRAWVSQVTRIGEIRGQVKLEEFSNVNQMKATDLPDYWVQGGIRKSDVGIPVMLVVSRHEWLSDMYRARSSGFCCDGPAMHCYPPLRPGPDKRCVAVPCPGAIP